MKTTRNHSPGFRTSNIVVFGFAYFMIAVLALYFLNPAYSLVKSFEGNYDLESYEFLIASTFFALGLGSLALVVEIFQKLPRSAGTWIGLLFLGMWAVGIIAAGIFPANEGGSTVPHETIVLLAGIIPVRVIAYPETNFSFIHIFVILGSFFSLAAAAVPLTWSFRRADKSRLIRTLSSILATTMVIASILLFLPAINILSRIWSISLELLTFSSLLWLFLTAARLRSSLEIA